jgi:hypothetical protein
LSGKKGIKIGLGPRGQEKMKKGVIGEIMLRDKRKGEKGGESRSKAKRGEARKEQE